MTISTKVHISALPPLLLCLILQVLGHFLVDDGTVFSHVEERDLFSDILIFRLRCKHSLRKGTHAGIGFWHTFITVLHLFTQDQTISTSLYASYETILQLLRIIQFCTPRKISMHGGERGLQRNFTCLNKSIIYYIMCTVP